MENWIPIAEELKSDSLLGPIVKAVGPPTAKKRSQPFRALIEAILSQQLAPGAAKAIISRVRNISPPFPSAERLVQLSPTELRTFGVSAQKAKYIHDLCEHWKKASWRRGWEDLEDEQLIERLTQVKGIGEWTAQMYLIFSVGRIDILALKDYGLQRGYKILFDLDSLPTAAQLIALSERWKGKRSVTSWYIWKAVDRKILKDENSESSRPSK